MSNSDNSTGFAVQTAAGGLAAVTAALLGSTLGVAGTVLGAGVASVVTTVAAALYLRSIQRTRDAARLVHARVTGTTPAAEPDPDPVPTPKRRRWLLPAAGAALAFAVAIAVITGVEWLTGERLSGGPGTTIGGVVVRPHSTQERIVPPATTSNEVWTTTGTPTLTSVNPPPSTTTTTPAPTTSDSPASTTVSPPSATG